MDPQVIAPLVSLVIGWAVGIQQRADPAPCQCQCGCQCESSLSTGSWLVLLIGPFVCAALVGGIWFHRQAQPAFVSEAPPGKGQRGVFGVQGRSLSLTS